MRAFPPLSSSSSAQREQHSLFGEILDWMLAPLLLLWPMSVALTWLVAQNIAARPYDRDLAQLTRLIARQMAAEAGPAMAGTPLRLPESAAALLRSDDVDRVYFQVLGSQGELIAGDHEVPLPDLERSATGEVQFRDETIQNESVRVASLRPAAGETALSPIFLVQVAETLDKRSRLATEIIKGVILPQFVILPLAVLLVWFALARGIAPLNQLQQRIRQRESHDLSPIDEQRTLVLEVVATIAGYFGSPIEIDDIERCTESDMILWSEVERLRLFRSEHFDILRIILASRRIG